METNTPMYGWNSANPTEAHRCLLPSIVHLLPSSKPITILDAGCGNGYIAGKMANLGHDVVGIDKSKDGIEIARHNYPDIQFEVCSVYDCLNKIINDVDLVISSEVIEHLYFPQVFLRNIYEVLKPKGWLIITTPYHGYLKNLTLSILNRWDKHFTVDWEGGHIKFFSENTLSRMLKGNGFDSIEFRNAGRIPWFWKSIVCRARKYMVQ